jgi:predicted outer membrane repeat protein
MKNPSFLTVGLGLFTLGISINFIGSKPVYAAGIVGNGTATSCTETALNTALVSGGNVTFNCGANPVTIKITTEKQITVNTVIDGGSKIVLDGGSARRILSVKNQALLTVKNLTLANGKTSGEGAAIMVNWRGKLAVSNCRFSNNISTQTGEAGGGAIFIASESTATIDKGIFTGNKGSLGGAIRNLLSNLTITNSQFDNNQAIGTSGGAIYIDGANGDNGKIIITNSKFTNNKTATQGGALFNFLYNKNTTTITNSTFTGNTAKQGAGIWTSAGNLSGLTGFTGTGNQTIVTINKTTINGNTATEQGAGIWHGNHAMTNVNNSTIANNFAKSADGKNGLGGGIMLVADKMTFNNVTIANNQAGFQGGGIFGGNTNSILKNTLVANNKAYNGGNTWNIKHNCANLLGNGGNNLQFPAKNPNDPSDTNCTNSIKIADPKLGALANNGGGTQTMLLLTGSGAINGGNNSTCLTTDQRGIARPQRTVCDIGAVELP